MFYTVIKTFLKETTTWKFLLTDKNTCEELIGLFHPSQLEERFGGEAKNTYSYWPPIFPVTDDFGENRDLILEGEEYLKMLEDWPSLIPSKKYKWECDKRRFESEISKSVNSIEVSCEDHIIYMKGGISSLEQSKRHHKTSHIRMIRHKKDIDVPHHDEDEDEWKES